MVWCKICDIETDIETDEQRGISCCVECGSVLDDLSFSQDVTFQKDSAGESTVVGQFVNESGVARGIGRIHGGRVYAYQAESHERAQQRGRQHIAHLVDQLKVKPREESIESAHRVYKMALQKGFTRGRRTSHVAAACLYLLCRQDDKPFFLIDFSDILQVSVFSLGAVFLQLAKLLRLENQPQFTKPVDPSLYIHRFADKMGYADDMLRMVSQTAMRLVASMKRDWIQTGRRPSGVCGAALYIATHLHGNPRTKREIVNVVHIGEFTLSKRLNEFATTPAGEMNKREFLEHSEMLERQEKLAIESAKGEALPESAIGGCYHVQQDQKCHFRQGLCKECYLTFVGCTGVYEGANPPSFSRNREKESRELLALEAKEKEEGEEGEENARPKRGDKSGKKSGIDAIKAIEGARSDAGHLGENCKEDGEGDGDEGKPFKRRRSSRVAKLGAGRERQVNETSGGTVGEAAPTEADTSSLKPKKPTAVKSSKSKRAETLDIGDDESEEELDLPGPRGGLYTDNIDSAVVEAAENVLESFEDELARAEEEDAKKRRKRMSTAQLVAQASRFAVEEAAVALGESRDMIVAGRGESLPLAVVGDFSTGNEQTQEELDELLDENLSDISDSEIAQYIAEEEEVKCKEEIWNMMNQDWMEKQEAKKAAQAAQLRAQEEQRLAMERAQKAGVAYKRGRGRPLGSKSKPKTNDSLPMAETPEEAAMRVMDDKKLSAKINYSVLQQLFERDGASSNLPLYDDGGAGGAELAPKRTTMGHVGSTGIGTPSTVIPPSQGERNNNNSGGVNDTLPKRNSKKKVSVPSSAKRGKPPLQPPPKFPSAVGVGGAADKNPSMPRLGSLQGPAEKKARGDSGTFGSGGRNSEMGRLGGLRDVSTLTQGQRLGGLTKPRGIIARPPTSDTM